MGARVFSCDFVRASRFPCSMRALREIAPEEVVYAASSWNGRTLLDVAAGGTRSRDEEAMRIECAAPFSRDLVWLSAVRAVASA
jgi:hypothetical protein